MGGKMCENVLRTIERGTFMIRENKKRSEEIYVRMRLESGQIVTVNKNIEFDKKGNENEERILVDLFHIVDIRNNDDKSIFIENKSRHRQDESKCIEKHMTERTCEFKFSIFHGCQFNLKIISLRAPDTTSYLDWVTGLQFLLEQQTSMSYEMKIESWLWKQYYEIGERVTDNNTGALMEIDDEFIVPNIKQHNRCSSLANIPIAAKDGTIDSKADKMSNKFRMFSSHQRNMSTSDLDHTSDRGQSSKSSTMTRDSGVLRSSKQLNLTHFRRYSWCSNTSVSGNSSYNQRRFASTNYEDESNRASKMFDVKISPKQLRIWLAQQNGSKVDLDCFKEYSSNYQPKPNFVDFNGFTRLYKDLLYQPELFLSSIEKRLTEKLSEKKDFNIKMPGKETMITSGLNDLDRDWIQTIYDYSYDFNFDLSALDKCFNHCNIIWDPRRAAEVYQDMDRPLSEYYISSSHNTYLTGDQITSKSSCEAYVRCIQMGCRSVELDCWNGDTEPIIYHGNTLTSKIALIDVLRTIKKYAWQYSNYPLILSLEDHCDVQQQTIIAQMMQETFQDDLLKSPIRTSETSLNKLPSPNQLKRKVIIKHKKLNIDGMENITDLSNPTSDISSENGMDHYIHHGRMYMKDISPGIWIPFYFLLSHSHTLSYSEDNSGSDMDQDNILYLDKDHNGQMNGNFKDIPRSSTYFVTIDQGEKLAIGNNDHIHRQPSSNITALPWYYGTITRSETNKWLTRHWFMGDGTFIIRDSESFANNYSLSFYRKDNIHHVRICRFYDEQSGVYFLGFEHSDVKFLSMEQLVKYYQENDMVALDFNIRLKSQPPDRFENKPWFYENPPMNKSTTEELLNKIPLVGTFLVRRKKRIRPLDNSSPDIVRCNDIEEHFVLSYKGRMNGIHHCTINYDNFKYSIYGISTYSLVELVEYLSSEKVIDGIKLRYPVDMDLIKKYNSVLKRSNESNFSIDRYTDNKDGYHQYLDNINDSILCASVTADNLLNLQQHSTNFTVNLPTSHKPSDDNNITENPLGNMEMGQFQLDSDCSVDIIDGHDNENLYPFDLYISEFQVHLACETEDQRSAWINAINSCIYANDDSDWHAARRKKEIEHQIAKSLSDLVIYCSSVPLNWPEKPEDFEFLFKRSCLEMSSLNENKFFKLLSSKSSFGADDNFPLEDTTKRNDISAVILKALTHYHSVHLSRVYPKATRLDSSNLSPIIPWLSGVQMTALNFQTPDRSLQINQALFRDNGGCGYVLKNYSLFQASQYINLNLTFLGARHLPKVSRGLLEIEIISAYEDICDRKVMSLRSEITIISKDIPDIGFQVKNPDFSFIRFSFGSEDKISQNKRLNCCQTTFPIKGILPGIRAVHLRNGFDILYELATLLFHVDISIRSTS